MNRRLQTALEIFFVSVIILDSFLLFISIFIPLRPLSFMGIAEFDLFASIVLLIGYILRMRGRSASNYIKNHPNGILAVIPIYFIGLNILELYSAIVILKILCLFKIFALIMASRQVAKVVDEFVEKSRLIYGFSFFIVVLLICSIVFFIVESGVNPQVATYEDSLWYVIQTITTVGYGDVVPFTQMGRLMGVIAMTSAIGISSLITASATSSLIQKFKEERNEMMDDTVSYVQRIEQKVEKLEEQVARKEQLEELNRNLVNIRSEIETLKDILNKK
ncbi:ion channel [Methanobacterium sp. ACI-7]|uniref:ion channel n=1 Tax=unclassified Methanobacterium TaxID=2627676 RepID=UPI0039C3799C